MRLSSSSAQELTACQLPLECKLLASRALAPFHLLHPQTFSIHRPSASPGTRRNSGDPSALHQGRPQLSMRRGLLARGARPRPVRPAPSWAGWPWDLSPRQRVLPLARSCARLSAVTDAPPGSPARPRDGPQALRLRGGAPRRRQPELPQRPVRRGRGAVQPRAAGAGGARALALVPFSLKPLLRRASAYEALEKYPLAYVDYKTALQIDDRVTSALEGINRMSRALMDSLGPEWRLKLPLTPLVPVSAQKRWESLPSECRRERAKSKLRETTTAKSRVPSAGDVERARVLKEEGNELVKKGNHKKAIEKYSESLSFSDVESATYSNRALCHLVLKQYKEAVKDCTEALRLDGRNVKAFYRRAQAYKALKDYKSSFEDISCLLQLEPGNGPAQKLQQEVNQSLN
ncbi:mitochondrial import receptor subunit TOM34 isoform X1 [Panthera tigris]|uniref:mitochondrial import receptor subunit TOM34 isoform X1 n=1 Tax=Panthera tigris TaxID=9694 RepID=UPI001C6F628C|nr:mitochondrial import receptor subunit TOM34 isoform X1 [Panthera tigris]